jgi:hypothetical protein
MNTSIDKSRTVLTISMGFLVLFLITDIQWFIWASLVIGIAGVLSNFLSGIISDLWMRLARILSYIVPNILLTLVFFIILFPLSLLSRVFSKAKDPLKLKKAYSTTFSDVNTEYNKEYFEKMW